MKYYVQRKKIVDKLREIIAKVEDLQNYSSTNDYAYLYGSLRGYIEAVISLIEDDYL